MVLGVFVEGGLSEMGTFHDFPPFRGRSGRFCFRPSMALAVFVEGPGGISKEEDCLDNSMMENLFGLLRTEHPHLSDFETDEDFKEQLHLYR